MVWSFRFVLSLRQIKLPHELSLSPLLLVTGIYLSHFSLISQTSLLLILHKFKPPQYRIFLFGYSPIPIHHPSFQSFYRLSLFLESFLSINSFSTQDILFLRMNFETPRPNCHIPITFFVLLYSCKRRNVILVSTMLSRMQLQSSCLSDSPMR